MQTAVFALVMVLLVCGHDVVDVDFDFGSNNIDNRALFFNVDIFEENLDYYLLFEAPVVLLHLACNDVPPNPATFYGIAKDILRGLVQVYAKEKCYLSIF